MGSSSTWRVQAESAYKHKGFVNFIVESLAINASRLMKYSEFAIPSCGHGVAMLESPYTNNGFANSILFSSSNMHTNL